MASFLIVGAGQSGLQLGIGLLDDGHDVTVANDRTPEDVRNGRLLSGQTMFGAALGTERALHIDLWQQECPQLEGMAFALFNPGDPNPIFDWGARLHQPGQSVDQRVWNSVAGTSRLHRWGSPSLSATATRTTS